MALKRTSSATHSPTAIPRASSDIAMATRTSIQTPPPPLSSCMPATSLNTVSGVSKSSRWLPHIMPIEGSEATAGDKTDPEQAVEVEEELALDDRKLPLAYNYPRHQEEICGEETESQKLWKTQMKEYWQNKEKLKTVDCLMVFCLNLDVAPPDTIKIEPCARLEGWIDPLYCTEQTINKVIGDRVVRQYKRWQPHARYVEAYDPPITKIKELATGLRRNARDERVLFHYNGHGVPKPTSNGEIWVFNRSYTQYIPLSLYDLQTWMGSPSIFVYDCSNAGIIVNSFDQFAEQHERDYQAQVSQSAGQGKSPNVTTNITAAAMRNCIQLAACSATQLLPMNPELPADLFTACLTTPIKMALRWFVMQNQGKLAPRITLEMLDKIPGQFGDRRTMLGELNWIFTAITDTIAWNTLPRTLFQKLFRQDLLVASLFRNFLLAERVMRSYDCTPVSQPSLPATHQHAMWQAWDFAVDISLSQLPNILERNVQYNASSFFEEQLTAFEVWLKYGGEKRPPPEQLPIVLQVLLSQAHRLRALDLLGRFLDLGPWAVNLALSVGIFPYVLKLLQSSARELRPLLCSIWAKLLAYDESACCKENLINTTPSLRYFITVLEDASFDPKTKVWAAYVIATCVDDHEKGQKQALEDNFISIALNNLSNSYHILKQWLAISIGRLWYKDLPAHDQGACCAHERLFELLRDGLPEVRAAAVFALGSFLNHNRHSTIEPRNLVIIQNLLNDSDHGKDMSNDGSSLVRKELLVALEYIIISNRSYFKGIEFQSSLDDKSISIGNEKYKDKCGSPRSYKITLPRRLNSFTTTQMPDSHSQFNVMHLSKPLRKQVNESTKKIKRLSSLGNPLNAKLERKCFNKLWDSVIKLSFDPNEDVAQMAITLILHVNGCKSSDEKISKARDISSLIRDSQNNVKSLPSPLTISEFAKKSLSTGVSRTKSLPQRFSNPILSEESVISQRTQLKETENVNIPSQPIILSSYSNEIKSKSISQKISDINDNSYECKSSEKLKRRQRGSIVPHCTKNKQIPSNVEQTPSSLRTIIELMEDEGFVLLNTDKKLSTLIVSWCDQYFKKQLMSHECIECDCDHESNRHWKKEWLYNRNHGIRLEAERQHELIKKGLVRVDSSPRFSALTASSTYVLKMLPNPGTPANVIAFHPYNPKIVVAGNNHIQMWDIEKGTVLSSPELKQHRDQPRQQNLKQSSNSINNLRVAQITSLDYINAHEDALLLVACDDGTLRLYKDCDEEGDELLLNLEESMSTMNMNSSTSSLNSVSGSRIGRQIRNFQSKSATTHRLVSAWNGLRELVGYSYRGGLNPVTSGLPVHTAWSQFDLSLAVGGDARYIRLWDAHKEMKSADLPTGCDSYVSSLTFSSYYAASSTSGIFTAGFGDGSVKLFDIRTPDSGVATFSDLQSPILDCRLQEETVGGQQIIIAGSANGEVRIYEPRKSYMTPRVSSAFNRISSFNENIGNATLGTISIGHPVTGLAIHQRAQLFSAWTPHNQQVSVHLIRLNKSDASYTNTSSGGGISSILNVIKYHDEGMLGHKLGQEGCLMFHPHLVQLAIGSKEGAISIKKVKAP